jgi:protein SCO1/2
MSAGRGLGGLAGIVAIMALAALLAGVWFGLDRFASAPPAAERPAAQLQAGTALPQPKPLAHFVLVDQDGREFTEARLRGRWTFAAIGYTTCPDVCPMTMATFVALQQRLAAPVSDEGPRFLFISVDPERDTPERLAQYVHHFDSEFLGATGSDAALHALVADLGGLYARAEDPGSALGYTMDHSASIYLIDPQARLAAIFSTPHDPAMMAQDYGVLSGGAASSSQSR